MKPVNVLLTTCGALTSPSLIGALKDNGEREVRVVGVDNYPQVAGAYLADGFHQVPSSADTEHEFVDALERVIAREEISVILPCGHGDCLAVSKNHARFDALGAKAACSPYEVLVRGFDKGLAYQTLRDAGAGAPVFHTVSTFDEFEAAANRLGYPGRPVVLKPPLNRGGRGVMVLEPDVDLEHMLQSKANIHYSYDYVAGLLQHRGSFPKLILMEYLPGEMYSVDMLADSGIPLATVPKVRQWGTPSQTLRGVVDLNPSVIEVAERACRAFGFSYNINFEIKLNEAGDPIIYDPNPRLAASTAFCNAAGANLVYLAVKMALGEPFESPVVQDGVTMVRYFKEMYLQNGEI